jgi:flagellar motor switch/type III secretory pathway protein FliN
MPNGVKQIGLDLTIVVGEVSLPLAEVTRLARGAVISLRRDAKEPLAVNANGARIADARVQINGERVAVVMCRKD